MVLEDIEKKLKELDENVYYGLVDTSQRETVWDFIVFNRSVMRPNKDKTSYTDIYSVHIFRENFIPEGFELEVIKKVCEISGMRLAGNDSVYDYMVKPNTNMVVEMLSIDFTKAKKA